ncbi:MAG TPA: SPASM domain-containing protein, partial [bacterium]|nr:SPASM domain-containing protein [bacterium]
YDKDKDCAWPLKQCLINSAGEVYPCCFSGNCSMGNVLHQGFEAVWFGERYEKLRKKRHLPPCHSCNEFLTIDDIEAHFSVVLKETLTFRQLLKEAKSEEEILEACRSAFRKRDLDPEMYEHAGEMLGAELTDMVGRVSGEDSDSFWKEIDARIEELYKDSDVEPAEQAKIDFSGLFLGSGWGMAESYGLADRCWRWMGANGWSSVFLRLKPGHDYLMNTVIHTALPSHAVYCLKVEVNGVDAVSQRVACEEGVWRHLCELPQDMIDRTGGYLRLVYHIDRSQLPPGTLSDSEVKQSKIALCEVSCRVFPKPAQGDTRGWLEWFCQKHHLGPEPYLQGMNLLGESFTDQMASIDFQSKKAGKKIDQLYRTCVKKATLPVEDQVEIDLSQPFLGVAWGASARTAHEDGLGWRWLGPDGTGSVFLRLNPENDYLVRTIIHDARPGDAVFRVRAEVNGVAAENQSVRCLEGLYWHSCRVPGKLVRRDGGRIELSFYCVRSVKWNPLTDRRAKVALRRVSIQNLSEADSAEERRRRFLEDRGLDPELYDYAFRLLGEKCAMPLAQIDLTSADAQDRIDGLFERAVGELKKTALEEEEIKIDLAGSFLGTGWGVAENYGGGLGSRWLGPQGRSDLFLFLNPDRDYRIETVLHDARPGHAIYNLFLTVNGQRASDQRIDIRDSVYRHLAFLPVEAISAGQPVKLEYRLNSNPVTGPGPEGLRVEEAKLALASVTLRSDRGASSDFNLRRFLSDQGVDYQVYQYSWEVLGRGGLSGLDQVNPNAPNALEAVDTCFESAFARAKIPATDYVQQSLYEPFLGTGWGMADKGKETYAHGFRWLGPQKRSAVFIVLKSGDDYLLKTIIHDAIPGTAVYAIRASVNGRPAPFQRICREQRTWSHVCEIPQQTVEENDGHVKVVYSLKGAESDQADSSYAIASELAIRMIQVRTMDAARKHMKETDAQQPDETIILD